MRAQDLFSIDVRDHKLIMSRAFLYDHLTDRQEKVSVIENVKFADVAQRH